MDNSPCSPNGVASLLRQCMGAKSGVDDILRSMEDDVAFAFKRDWRPTKSRNTSSLRGRSARSQSVLGHVPDRPDPGSRMRSATSAAAFPVQEKRTDCLTAGRAADQESCDVTSSANSSTLSCSAASFTPSPRLLQAAFLGSADYSQGPVSSDASQPSLSDSSLSWSAKSFMSSGQQQDCRTANTDLSTPDAAQLGDLERWITGTNLSGFKQNAHLAVEGPREPEQAGGPSSNNSFVPGTTIPRYIEEGAVERFQQVSSHSPPPSPSGPSSPSLSSSPSSPSLTSTARRSPKSSPKSIDEMMSLFQKFQQDLANDTSQKTADHGNAADEGAKEARTAEEIPGVADITAEEICKGANTGVEHEGEIENVIATDQLTERESAFEEAEDGEEPALLREVNSQKRGTGVQGPCQSAEEPEVPLSKEVVDGDNRGATCQSEGASRKRIAKKKNTELEQPQLLPCVPPGCQEQNGQDMVQQMMDSKESSQRDAIGSEVVQGQKKLSASEEVDEEAAGCQSTCPDAASPPYLLIGEAAKTADGCGELPQHRLCRSHSVQGMPKELDQLSRRRAMTDCDTCHHSKHWRVYMGKAAVKNGMSKEAFEGGLKLLGRCSSVKAFELRFGSLLDKMRRETALHVFRGNVRPLWEDAANAGRSAGKWTILLPGAVELRKMCRAVLLELMTDSSAALMNGVNGMIVTCKRGRHMLVLWTRGHDSGIRHDVFDVRQLIAQASQTVGIPACSATFKPHARKTSHSEQSADSDFVSSIQNKPSMENSHGETNATGQSHPKKRCGKGRGRRCSSSSKQCPPKDATAKDSKG